MVAIQDVKSCSGFTLLSCEELPEIDGVAYRFVHEASKARLLWLANSDENKAFAIGFKTPPKDDTGVFHIIEHSVLDGSEKYPLKEPFVNLLKTSMQTFLNALTFFDKTMYPVASTNEKDLKNLADVYLDAVLHPQLHERDAIFAQEGWHLELDESGNGVYNGVVYNEMRGALSSSEDVLLMKLKEQLFPDTAYGFESGGNPKHIPELTLEDFQDTHKRYYSLANAYVVLYGALDYEDMLAFLNERFEGGSDGLESAGAPNPLNMQAPVDPAPYVYEMSTTPDNAMVGAGYVFATHQDREELLAAQVLLDALMASNETPLKRALLEANLGNDVEAYLMDGILQPFVVFEVKGARPGCAEEFRSILERECARLVSEGIDTELLEAALSQLEFNLREGDFGYPDGVGLAIASLASWLYDDENATGYIKYLDACEDLRKNMGLGIFEKLLDKMVVSCSHKALVTIDAKEPSKAEADAIAGVELTKVEAERVQLACEELKKEQTRTDLKEDSAKIPMLTLSDIAKGPAVLEAQKHEQNALISYHYSLATHGISYVTLYFDLQGVAFEELPYVSLLASLLGKLDTRQHTALELDTLLTAQLGNFACGCDATFVDGAPLEKSALHFTVSVAALEEKVTHLATLPSEVLLTTLFEDQNKMRNILTQVRVGMEEHFLNAGHTVGISAANASFSKTALANEQLAGIPFYRFLCGLLEEWDTKWIGMGEVLRNLCARIFKAKNFELAFAGSEQAYRTYMGEAGDFGLERSPLKTPARLKIPTPTVQNVAFAIPSDVCYVSRAQTGLEAGAAYRPSWAIAAQALNYSYLWQTVRVLGGAYGAGIVAAPSSLASFYSYRDPAVASTLEAYNDAASWLKAWQPEERELAGYIIASVAKLDAPLKPAAAMKRAETLRLSGRPFDWTHKMRTALLACTLDEVHGFGEVLERANKQGAHSVVCLGNKHTLEESGIPVQELM